MSCRARVLMDCTLTALAICKLDAPACAPVAGTRAQQPAQDDVRDAGLPPAGDGGGHLPRREGALSAAILMLISQSDGATMPLNAAHGCTPDTLAQFQWTVMQRCGQC